MSTPYTPIQNHTPTPGPWRVGDAGASVFGPKRPGDVPAIVAQRTRRADAALIAAAPELVAALTAAVEILDADGIVYGHAHGTLEPLDVLRTARALLARIGGAR